MKTLNTIPRLDLPTARRVVVAIAGGTLTLIGVALLVLPGPGVLVIAAGFSVLATEFVWARRMLRRARDTVAGSRPRESGSGSPE